MRRGRKITPSAVVRIFRTRDRRLVWLEEGDDDSGLGHLMQPERVAEFESFGVARSEIVDVLVRALTGSAPVGISGKDRLVYEVRHGGKRCRIAVTVGSNGSIVGANPISADRKLKPLP
ncbi:hypothetical protein [Saccharomonospora iraqiensis]|uniref:hypothetical protein n=1 Tax=Saccharomonospora iraqiensis TaxID=52698 RepID=UPI00022E8994|nr:hypothetical protein [Saccharomonospora iraqiensis]